SGSRFGGGSGSGGSSGGTSGSRFGSGGSGSGGSSGSGGGTSPFGGNRPSTSTSTGSHPTVKPDDKKDDSSSGKNIFGRQTGSDTPKKDDKPEEKKGGSPFSRFGGGGDKPADKKDDKSKTGDADKKGGGAGGFLNRGKKDEPEKKADTKGKADDKSKDGEKKGGIGALAGALPFGRGKPADDKKTDTKSKGDDKKQSPFGAKSGGIGSATKTDDKSKGKGDDKSKGKAAASTATSGSFLDRIRSRVPLLAGAKESKKAPASKTRTAKVPQPVGEGLSLDQKLDILGVVLMFSAVAIFLSSLSGQQGSLTGTINNFFSQLLGQGAVVVPLVFGGVGFWLILRHFGEEAPRIDPIRISGLVLLYVSALMLLMFIETFNYTTATRETFPLYIEQSIAQGQGGGQVGAYLYNLLVMGMGELPAVAFIFGLLVVSVMLITRTSAAELTVYVISIWRSFRMSMQRRAQKRNAMRTALLEERA
ncbi:MAG: DNA translocase FtsK 4TM domain-containing protein, partial [Anaerolineae bacterium]|nr:DNA translocase FtsK 4TM domain-containing protein [Anaerolineae bacterium]